MSAPMLPWPHGTRTGYTSHGCRCEHCREADRLYQRDRVARLRAKGLPPGDARHGTLNGRRKYGCRCALCTEASRSYDRAWRASR